MEKFNLMLKETVYKGGNSLRKGIPSIQSPVTVIRKFRVLASAYSLAISKGFNIENFPQKVIASSKHLI